MTTQILLQPLGHLPKPYKFEKLKEIMNTLEADANQIIPSIITTSKTV